MHRQSQDGSTDESTDETLQNIQEREIRDEIAQSMMLIGPREPVETLANEYKDDLYLRKIRDLVIMYGGLRRVRPDGNCFFRGFGFAYLEYLLTDREECIRFADVVESSRERLLVLGYPEFTLTDICEGFSEVLSTITERPSFQELYSIFNEQAHSDYVVSYLRLVVSVHIRERAEFYQNFMEEGVTVEEFCRRVVEPMNKESDHIHITALCSALEIGIRVRYMDRSVQGGVNAHDFPETLSRPVVHLLYRPGHYDILYPNSFVAPPAKIRIKQ